MVLGRSDAVWLLVVVVPFGLFVGGFGAPVVGLDPPDLVGPLAVLGTAGGMLLGVVFVAMSRTRHTDAILDGTDDVAEWTVLRGDGGCITCSSSASRSRIR